MPPKSKKTATRSFRIDETALEVIEKDAGARNISVNTLVNQILLSYANFDHYLMQLPMIRIASDTFGYLLEAMSDENVSEAGRRTAANIVKSIILSKHGEVNLNSVLDYFKLISDYGKIYSYNESEANGNRTITLIHKWGRKGSLYFVQYAMSIFEMIDVQPKITTTENSVTIAF